MRAPSLVVRHADAADGAVVAFEQFTDTRLVTDAAEEGSADVLCREARGDAVDTYRRHDACGVDRRDGAAALDLAYVAAGRFDGFWEEGLSAWDIAAGVLLVREAGGFVSDYRGQDRMEERREYLAASGELHSRLHKLLATSLR